MKYIIFILSFVLFGCTSKQEDKALPEMTKTFPFSEADKIEIWSYEFDYEDVEDEDNYTIKQGRLKINPQLKDNISLTKTQQQELFNILYTEACPEEYLVADCYNPAHRLVFYDKNGDVIAYLEICLSCIGYRVSEKFMPTARLCDIKMKELESFFKNVGIKHFNEY